MAAVEGGRGMGEAGSSGVDLQELRNRRRGCITAGALTTFLKRALSSTFPASGNCCSFLHSGTMTSDPTF